MMLGGSIGNRRNALFAFIASLVSPGLGHMYVGRLRAGVVIALVLKIGLLLPMVVGAALFTRFMPWIVWTIALLAIGVYLGVAVHAVRIARREQIYALRPYNRTVLYLLFFVLAYVVGQMAALPVRELVVEPFRAASSAMAPSLLAGDHFFIAKVGPLSPIERGAIVVYESPGTPGVNFVHRVIGLPGDRLTMRSDVLSINGNEVSRRPCDPPEVTFTDDGFDVARVVSATCHREVLGGTSWRTASEFELSNPDIDVTVPADHVFVVGDFRTNSADSRYSGPVPLGNVKGRGTAIFFSLTPGELTPRWGRMGEQL